MMAIYFKLLFRFGLVLYRYFPKVTVNFQDHDNGAPAFPPLLFILCRITFALITFMTFAP